MATRKELEERLAHRKLALKHARETHIRLLHGGVKSYSGAGRNATKLELRELEASIRQLEKEIAALENQLGGNSGFGLRRTIGVVPRDW